MSCDKNPISILQEYAMANGIAPPSYIMSNEGLLFTCTVTIGNITKSGTAANKKKAKQCAAENALSVLLPHTCKSVDRTHTIVSTQVNSVGLLNEFCSKNRKDYPHYEYSINGQEFIATCKLLKYVTEGKGKSKMDAKQMAAGEMLDRVQSLTLTSDANVNYNTAPYQKVIDLYQKLSLLNSNVEVSVPSRKTDDVQSLHLNQLHEKDLEGALNKLGVKYKIDTFQENPIILCLITDPMNGNTSYTFLECGDNLKDTKLMLLKKTIEAVRINLN